MWTAHSNAPSHRPLCVLVSGIPYDNFQVFSFIVVEMSLYVFVCLLQFCQFNWNVVEWMFFSKTKKNKTISMKLQECFLGKCMPKRNPYVDHLIHVRVLVVTRVTFGFYYKFTNAFVWIILHFEFVLCCLLTLSMENGKLHVLKAVAIVILHFLSAGVAVLSILSSLIEIAVDWLLQRFWDHVFVMRFFNSSTSHT